MEILGGLGLNLLASAVFAVLGFIGARFYDSFRKRRLLGHIDALLGTSRRITVVFPSGATVPVAEGRPLNAVRMSLAEGAAIARIGQICRDARAGTDMYLVHPDDLHPNRGPFVMVGDPRGSAWSKMWLADKFPQLRFSPEEHRVDYDSASWETRIVDRSVKHDFGFIIVGRTDGGQRFAMVWGTSEFGTNIAARAFADLHGRLSRERYRDVLSGENWLFVARAVVEGYGVRTDDVSNVSVVGTYRGRS